MGLHVENKPIKMKEQQNKTQFKITNVFSTGTVGKNKIIVRRPCLVFCNKNIQVLKNECGCTRTQNVEEAQRDGQ